MKLSLASKIIKGEKLILIYQHWPDQLGKKENLNIQNNKYYYKFLKSNKHTRLTTLGEIK